MAELSVPETRTVEGRETR